MATPTAAGAAIQKWSDVEQVEHLVESDVALARRREPSPEQQVLPHREMGEEPPLLEDVADASAVFRNERSAVGVGAAPGAAIPQLMSWA